MILPRQGMRCQRASAEEKAEIMALVSKSPLTAKETLIA